MTRLKGVNKFTYLRSLVKGPELRTMVNDLQHIMNQRDRTLSE